MHASRAAFLRMRKPEKKPPEGLFRQAAVGGK